MARPTGTIASTWLPRVLVTLAVLLSGCGGGTPPPEDFPEFPWPPPEASATEVLPSDLLNLGVDIHTLGDIDVRLLAKIT